MEFKVFINMDAYTKRKPLFVKRVTDPDTFDLPSVMKTLRCLYGNDVYLEILICLL